MIPNTHYARNRFKEMDKQRVSLAVNDKYAIYNLTDKKFERLDSGLRKNVIINYLKKFYTQ